MVKLIWQDWILILALGFELLAHFVTIYLVTNVASYSHVNVTTATQAVESNPFQQNIVTGYYVDFLIQFLLYGLMLAIYLKIRAKALETGEFLLMNAVVLSIFLFTLADATNDLAYLFAFIFKV